MNRGTRFGELGFETFFDDVSCDEVALRCPGEKWLPRRLAELVQNPNTARMQRLCGVEAKIVVLPQKWKRAAMPCAAFRPVFRALIEVAQTAEIVVGLI